MWLFESRRRTARRTAGPLALALVAALGGCTSGPLYGTTDVDPVTGARSGTLDNLRGRIAVQEADTRTAQIFRNELLFDLNDAEPVRGPLFEVRYAIFASDSVVSIESGTGIPSASLYRMTVNYQLVRLSDGKVLDTGSRFAQAPYDRNDQQFASSRALIDARQQAGETVARQVLLAIAPVLQREGFEPVPAVVAKG